MFWEKAGPQNTDKVIGAVIQRAEQLKIKHMVIASWSGDTVQKILAQTRGLNIVCVTHHTGFSEPGINEMDPEMRRSLQDCGVQVLTATHLLAGVDRAIRNHFGGVYPAEIMAQTLRIFGQGIKVAVEISVMALDAGLIPYDEEIIAVGGSGTGADAAVVIKPAHSNHFFATEVREIICMPRVKKGE